MATLSWRIEAGVTAALRKEPWEVSRCSSEETFEKLCQAYYPHYTIGVDRQGRPVLVQKVRCAALQEVLFEYLGRFCCLQVLKFRCGTEPFSWAVPHMADAENVVLGLAALL